MRRLFISLVLFLTLIPEGVIAYDSPQDLLKLEKSPLLEPRLVTKFRVDPKQELKSKASILSIGGFF